MAEKVTNTKKARQKYSISASDLSLRMSEVNAFYPPDCPSLPLSLTTVTRVAAQPEAADHLLPF